ncbi:MAG: hypothetical protein RLZZ324_592, partial [Candidatus Parcubacteria bacterium]
GTTTAAPQAASQLTANDLITLTGDAVDFHGRGLMNLKFINGIESISGIGGNWSVDKDGKLAAKTITADMLTTKAITLTQADEMTTIDSATVLLGQSSAQVHNAAIKPSTRVFITFRKDPGSRWWVDEVGDGFFVVKTSDPTAQDSAFDYWLMQVDDKRTPPPVVNPAPDPSIAPVPVPDPTPVPAPDSSTPPATDQTVTPPQDTTPPAPDPTATL